MEKYYLSFLKTINMIAKIDPYPLIDYFQGDLKYLLVNEMMLKPMNSEANYIAMM